MAVETYSPRVVDNLSFETADKLDANGKWKQAVDDYYSIMQKSDVPVVDYPNGRSRALAGLALVAKGLGDEIEAEKPENHAYSTSPDLFRRGFI